MFLRVKTRREQADYLSFSFFFLSLAGRTLKDENQLFVMVSFLITPPIYWGDAKWHREGEK